MWDELIEGVREQQAFLDLLARSWSAEYAASGGKVHCGKGCAGCCSLVVNSSFIEAVAIARILTPAQMAAVRDHVERLRQKMDGVTELAPYLRMHRRETGGCPLLDSGGCCTIYPSRPLSCRSLLSTLESRWCSADFASLTAVEKEAFLNSLDRRVVAFPLHYGAVPQETGQELESESNRRMHRSCGFYLYGNLPVLLTLIADHRLDAACAEGRAGARAALARSGLDHPLLVTMSD